MSNELEKSKKTALPVLSELYADTAMVIKQNELNLLLNQPPAQTWISNHPIIKKVIINEAGQKVTVPAQYIPIERLEWLCTRIFSKYKTEIKHSYILANSVVVEIRFHYIDPITGEWEWTDGIGACPLQTDKDAGAIEFNKLKPASVQMAAPAAKTYAFKDAVESLGKLFGKDMNRAENVIYDSSLHAQIDEMSKLEAKRKLSDAIDLCQDNDLKNSIIDNVIDAEDNLKNTKDFYLSQLLRLTNGG